MNISDAERGSGNSDISVGHKVAIYRVREKIRGGSTFIYRARIWVFVFVCFVSVSVRREVAIVRHKAAMQIERENQRRKPIHNMSIPFDHKKLTIQTPDQLLIYGSVVTPS